MLNLILRAIRALLASLYMLFEGMPALEALRSWFGAGDMERAARARALTLLGAAGFLSVLAFLVFLWFLWRHPLFGRAPADGSSPAGPPEPHALGPEGSARV